MVRERGTVKMEEIRSIPAVDPGGSSLVYVGGK